MPSEMYSSASPQDQFVFRLVDHSTSQKSQLFCLFCLPLILWFHLTDHTALFFHTYRFEYYSTCCHSAECILELFIEPFTLKI